MATVFAASGPSKSVGAVYALTNGTAGNAVGVWDRAKDGTLTFNKTVSTGGLGIGDGPDTEGLQSQGALILGKNNKFLYAVNAGSDNITVFKVDHSDLSVVQTITSYGHRPISLTISGKLLYVLNFDRLAVTPDTGSIYGYTIGTDGKLSPIAGSTLALPSAGLNPGQIAFSPDGKEMAMTAKATNQLFLFKVEKSGIVDKPTGHPTAGTFPFSLAYAGKSTIVVADDFDDVAGAGAASSYIAGSDLSLKLISGAIPNHQDGTCWVVTTPGGKFAFVDNTNNSVVSGYSIGKDSSLKLLSASGKTGTSGGVKPRDMVLANNGKLLYTLNSVPGSVSAFSVNKDGSLGLIGTVSGITGPGCNGLAAR